MTQTLGHQLQQPARTGPDGAPVISVRELTKSYADHRVLTGLSFDVHPGEIFGILGPNGTGKTTCVEIVQGLRRADSGEVRVLGLDPRLDPVGLQTLVGSQLQSSALPDHLRVGEALRLSTRLAGDVVDWRRLLDEWELNRLERSSYRSLSGGERQRLFLALSLVNDPRVVFLDELTQGLDPVARRETWRLVDRIRDEGATVVLVSHYMDEVEHLCDRVGVLSDGRMDVIGTVDDLVAAQGGPVHTRFTLPDGTWVPALSALPGVSGVAYDGSSYDVFGDSSTTFLVAAALERGGCRPDDFTVVRPSLEDVFVALTQGGAR